MRSLLLVSILVLSFLQISAQTVSVTVKVDRRIELTSIIARLAGYEEYSRTDFKSYAADADKYFASFKTHPAVEYARKVRFANGIGYDAVPFLAVHLKPDLTPKFPFSAEVPEKRWGKKDAEEFARLLGQFARDSKADEFFSSHAAMYKTVESRMQETIGKVDFAWYRKFYGELPKGTLDLYIGLLNGGSNYGPKVVYPDGREELFAIIGAWKMDDQGIPVFSDDFLPTIIHEFNHSFINHLFYAREKNFVPAGEAIYKPVEEKMKRQAYANWKVAFIESLVRAAVTRYMFDHEPWEKANAELIGQRNGGFLWIDELFVLLGTYENNRKAYPTFRSFFPMIEAYAADLAKRIDAKAAHFASRQPRVVAIEGLTNGAQDVDPNLTQLTFRFDQPLAGKGVSFNFGPAGRAGYPIEKAVGYSEDKTKFTAQLKLQPDTEYEFIITGNGFKSVDGYPLVNETIKFRTRK